MAKKSDFANKAKAQKQRIQILKLKKSDKFEIGGELSPKVNLDSKEKIDEFINQNQISFFTDSRHGWIRVPLVLLREMAIADKISPYSYMDAEFAYLEEDADLSVFYDAIGIGYADGESQDKKELRQLFNKRIGNNYSPQSFIRNLSRYDANKFLFGGRLKSALNRDRKYTSEEEWEKNYKRAGRRKFYRTMEDGGDVKNYDVVLSANPNPNHTRTSHIGSIEIKPRKVRVGSFAEASRAVLEFINENDLGAGNWTGGDIYENGKVIAHVSYNGRIWEIPSGGLGSEKSKEILFDNGGDLDRESNIKFLRDQYGAGSAALTDDELLEYGDLFYEYKNDKYFSKYDRLRELRNKFGSRKVSTKDAFIHFISSGFIANNTGITDYNTIDEIRKTAIELAPSDEEYSVERAINVLRYAIEEIRRKNKDLADNSRYADLYGEEVMQLLEKKKTMAKGGDVKQNTWVVSGGGLAKPLEIEAASKSEAIDEAIARLKPVFGTQPKNRFTAVPKQSQSSSNKKTMAEGGGVEDVKVIKDQRGNTLYLTKIDSTHFFLSVNEGSKGNPYHIGQIKNEPYYHEVNEWLMSKSAEAGGVYSSDEMYVLKVYDLNGKLLDTKKFRERNIKRAKEYAIDMFEYDMQQKHGGDLRFSVELAPVMAKGGKVARKSVYDWLQENSDNILKYYLPGSAYDERIDQNDLREKGDYVIETEKDADGSPQAFIDICFGDEYDKNAQEISDNYESYARYLNKISDGEVLLDVQVLSNDDSRTIMFLFTDSGYHSRSRKYAEGGFVSADETFNPGDHVVGNSMGSFAGVRGEVIGVNADGTKLDIKLPDGEEITADAEGFDKAEPEEKVDVVENVQIEQPQTISTHCNVTRNMQKGGIEIKFPSKPDESVIYKLKSNGWRYSRFQNIWWIRYSDFAFKFAQDLCDSEASLSEPVQGTSSPKKIRMITQNTLTSSGRVPKNILRDEIRAGKLEAAISQRFDGMTDSYDYIKEADMVWFDPSTDSYLMKQIDNANTHWTNAITLDRENKISVGSYTLRYKPEYEEAPKAMAEIISESEISAQELYGLSVFKNIAAFARMEYLKHATGSLQKAQELRDLLYNKGYLYKVGTGYGLGAEGAAIYRQFKDKYKLISPSRYSWKDLEVKYPGQKYAVIPEGFQKPTSDIQMQPLKQDIDKTPEQKLPEKQYDVFVQKAVGDSWEKVNKEPMSSKDANQMIEDYMKSGISYHEIKMSDTNLSAASDEKISQAETLPVTEEVPVEQNQHFQFNKPERGSDPEKETGAESIPAKRVEMWEVPHKEFLDRIKIFSVNLNQEVSFMFNHGDVLEVLPMIEKAPAGLSIDKFDTRDTIEKYFGRSLWKHQLAQIVRAVENGQQVPENVLKDFKYDPEYETITITLKKAFEALKNESIEKTPKEDESQSDILKLKAKAQKQKIAILQLKLKSKQVA